VKLDLQPTAGVGAAGGATASATAAAPADSAVFPICIPG
jgi:hypothetical protein